MNAAMIQSNTSQAEDTILRHIKWAISRNAYKTFPERPEHAIEELARVWSGWLEIKLDGPDNYFYGTHRLFSGDVSGFVPDEIISTKEANADSAFEFTASRGNGWLVTWAHSSKFGDPAFHSNHGSCSWRSDDTKEGWQFGPQGAAIRGKLTAVRGTCVSVDGDWDVEKFQADGDPIKRVAMKHIVGQTVVV